MPIAKCILPAALLLTALPSSAQTAADDTPKGRIGQFLAALGKGDERAFNAVTTPDYRAFENGKIYDRKGFYDLVQRAVRDGLEPNYEITDARFTVDDRVAAINYVSRGAYRAAGERKTIAWLESVTLRRGDAGWQIDFLESHVQSPPAPERARDR